MREQALNVYASPLPWARAGDFVHAIPGQTLQEIVNLATPRRLGVAAIVQIEGEIIPSKHWHKIRPKKNTLVTINIVPMGGKGKKNPLSTLLTIAVLVAAPYVGASVAGSLGITSQVGVSMVTGAVGAIGSMLVSALVPPPKPSGMSQISDAAESPTQFIEGANNAINPYGRVPVCLGTNRMFPPQAGRPFTETQGDQQFVRQLFTWGYGQKLVISDQKIAETPLNQYTGVQLEHRLNGDLHTGTTIYTNDVSQEDFSILIQQVDGYTLRTTARDTDEASVDITFAQGLTDFDDQGKRKAKTVELEIQYSPAGLNTWSPASDAYTAFGGQSGITFPAASLWGDAVIETVAGVSTAYHRGFRIDKIVVDPMSGTIQRIGGPSSARRVQDAQAPITPPGQILIATVTIKTERVNLSPSTTTSIVSMVDNRTGQLFGGVLQNSSSFVPTQAGNTVNVSGGGLKFVFMRVTGAQTEALRRSLSIKFPARGQYDIRIRRTTADTTSGNALDKAFLTAIRSITYRQPVNMVGICGTAMRIQASEQLNGAVGQYNAIVSNVIPCFNPDLGTWTDQITSNPAAIYRYVLQGLANDKAVADDRIDIEALEDWYVYCDEKGYTYDRIIDFDGSSIQSTLADVAAAGRATPDTLDGLYTIVIDGPKPDIVQVVTPRNSWDYKGAISYPDLPHAFRVEFRNRDKGYEQDERIVYADGYDESNATIFERLDYQSCTDADLAWMHGRTYLAIAKLRPEIHNFSQEVDNLTYTRGDRITFSSDVILVGVGDGRIKSMTYNYDSAGDPIEVTGFTIDDVVTVPNSSDFNARIRRASGIPLFAALVTQVGVETDTFTFVVPVDIDEAPEIGDLAQFAETGKELDLVVTRIEARSDYTARITALDYAPAIFDAESGDIPDFNSNITVPIDFVPPVAPILFGPIQSDESVMLRNSDGSYTGRMVINLTNNNTTNVAPVVRVRLSGTDDFRPANLLQSTPERVVLTGLEDGSYYDISIRYQRPGGLVLSDALVLGGVQYVGASGIPSDVTGFLITIAGETALFKWNPNPEIDIAGYRIRFSRLTSGVTWGTAQLLEDLVQETRLSVPYQSGTYLIKAVDILGNESAGATAIIAFDQGALRNVVANIDEHPDFLGVKDNVRIVNDAIQLTDPTQVGYYYFEEPFDMSEVYSSFVSASIVANGKNTNDVFAMDDVFAVPDMFGSMNNDVFAMANVFDVVDMFGIGLDVWSVQLEYRVTNDDPLGTPTWSDWMVFNAGYKDFRGIDFRLRMESNEPNVTPFVSVLSVLLDMPDRVEKGEDLTVSDMGDSITYDPPFKDNPAVNITIQDGDANDEIVFLYKESDGFIFRVYNTTAMAWVERMYDYSANGYGRVLT